MKKLLLALASLLLFPCFAKAQVTLQVTDTSSQTWNSGTWAVQLTPPNGFSVSQLRTNGNPVPNPTQNGTLSTTGGASITLTTNTSIAPTPSTWYFTVCPLATSGCFNQFVSITTSNQSVTLTPPPPVVFPSPSATNSLAYNDAEISGAVIGSTYYNTITNQQRVCNAPSPCTWGPAGGVGIIGSPILTNTNIIGDYRFTEGSGTTDIDVSGHSGPLTLVNAPAWVVGANGGGVTCTSGSSQYITVPTSITTSVVTIEMYVSVQYSNIGALQQRAIIINNGGGGTANTSGILADTSNAFLGPVNTGAPDIGAFKNGGFGEAYENAFNGTGLITWVKGSSADAIYLNGQQSSQLVQNSGTLGVDTGNNFQICGAAAGSGFASSTYLTMTVYWVRFFSAALTAPQVTTDYAGMSAIEAGNGFPVSVGGTDQVSYAIDVGDSLTASPGGSVAYPTLLTLNNSLVTGVRGVSGQQTSTLISNFPVIIPAFYRSSAQLSLFNYWEGTNDSGTLTAAQTAGNQRKFCTLVHQLGAKCALMTMIARGSSAFTFAENVNPLTRQFVANGYADMVIDIAADMNFAPGNAATGVCYLGDQTHYTTACSYNNVSVLVQAAMNSLYGNWSFGAANTYSSAGAAAIATTAGTESTNTMTFTSAGWTAATFVVGTRMVCAGITPAGYNGVWQILTNGGTTVTAYNGTTGLGPITVQGTCQGEQLQQADNYAILNNGGIFLLSSCLDWVGRNVNLWNINGSSSTLTVFNSETFVGSTTLTTNAVAILSSVLTSNTAGGCKWVRLQ
jgi:hypothetical protein